MTNIIDISRRVRDDDALRDDLTSLDVILSQIDDGYDMPRVVTGFVYALRDLQRAIEQDANDADPPRLRRAVEGVKQAWAELEAAHLDWAESGIGTL